MTDHDALQRAICEHPAEDTPRLVFADWLDEHADAFPTPAVARVRAQFIRDDITLSRLDEYDPARLRWELIEKPRREAEQWARAAMPSGCGGDPLFRRGFPWCAQLNPDQFLAHAKQLSACAPITTLAFSGAGTTDALVRSPHFARLLGLRVHGANLSEGSVRQVASSPHATALETLDLRDGGVVPGAIATLLRSPLFPRLAQLELGGGLSFGAAISSALSEVRAQTRLHDLTLTRIGLAGAQVQRLLTASALEHVERLRLAGNRLGPLGHEAIARLPLDHLRKLDLSDTAPGAEGFRALSTSLTLSRLERLGYRRNYVNGALVAELATCHEVSNLRVLDLAENGIGNAGATALARSPHFAGLRVLYLSYCMVGDEGMFALLESPLSESLVLLDLTGSPASAETQELLKAKMGDRVRI